jgi:hypothetical protein
VFLVLKAFIYVLVLYMHVIGIGIYVLVFYSHVIGAMFFLPVAIATERYADFWLVICLNYMVGKSTRRR